MPLGVAVHRNLAFGSSERAKLDVYVPQPVVQGAAPAPVVFFVHGGVWASGKRDSGTACLLCACKSGLSPLRSSNL